MADNTQTLVVQVQPAPASEENMAQYTNLFWTVFGVLIALWGWKKVQSIFDSSHDRD